jgi:hypothetical protein
MAEATAAPDPRLRPAREFFVQLRKATKTIGMYRHQEGRFSEFVQPAHALLKEVTATAPLGIKVTAESFLLGEEVLLTQDEGGENFPYRFFREGVRHLTLRTGITEDELKRLTLIMLTQSERTAVELVTLMWEAQFEHVDYVVVEGFSVGQLSEEQVKVQVDDVVDYLYARLRSEGSLDTLTSARISAADLDLRMEGIEQIRGAIFDGEAVSAAFKKKVQDELARDEQLRVPTQLIDLVVVQILESRFTDAAQPTELLVQLIDMLLLHEDLAPVARMLDLLSKLGGEEHPGATMARAVREAVAAKMGDEPRLRRLGEALKLNRGLNLSAAGRYLSELGPPSVPVLLEVLDTLEGAEARSLIIDALARCGQDRPELFAARLESDKGQTVRDMIAIVERGGFPDRARYIQTALKNPNALVRIDVIGILAASKTPEVVHRFVLPATTDKNAQVRAAAFRALVHLNPRQAARDLLRLPKLPDWEAREPKEKELLYECMGLTGDPEALKFLTGQLHQKKPLLGAKKVIESKLWAVAGLQAMGGIQVFRLLQQEVEAKADPAVVEAARKAMYEVKKALSGPTSGTIAARPAEVSTEQAAQQLFNAFESSAQDAAAESAAEKQRIQLAIAARAKAEAEAAAREAATQEAEKQRILSEERRRLLARPPPPPPTAPSAPAGPAEDVDLEFDPD